MIESTGDLVLEAAILSGIGRCKMVLGSYDEARYAFERARLRMKEAENEVGKGAVIASIGELNYWIAIVPSTLDRGARFKDALREYNEALTLLRAGADRTGEIGVLTNIGLVYDAWGKSHEALSYYMAALQRMDDLQTSARLEVFRIDLADQSARLYQRAIFLRVRLHHMEEAFDLSERAGARTFLDQLGNNRVNLASHFPADFAAREETLRQQNILLQRQIGQELAKPGPEVDPQRMRLLQSRLSVVRREYVDCGASSFCQRPRVEWCAFFVGVDPISPTLTHSGARTSERQAVRVLRGRSAPGGGCSRCRRSCPDWFLLSLLNY